MQKKQMLFIIAGIAIIAGLASGYFFSKDVYYNSRKYSNIGISKSAYDQLSAYHKGGYFKEHEYNIGAAFMGAFAVVGMGLIILGLQKPPTTSQEQRAQDISTEAQLNPKTEPSQPNQPKPAPSQEAKIKAYRTFLELIEEAKTRTRLAQEARELIKPKPKEK